MRLTTLRNLMLSMLVLGVAGSVIGAGTFATFNAVTTNPSNTFASGDIKFVNTNSGATACTAQSSVTGGVASGCGVLATLSGIIPGDSKIGTFTLANNSTTAPAVTVALTVGQTATSALDTNSPGSGATAGLAMLLFRCTNGSGVEQACSTATTTLVPVYPTNTACTANPVTGASGFTTADIPSAASATISIGGATCTGGPSSGGLSAVSNFAVGGPDTGATLGVGHTDNLAMVVYLPSTAGNAQAGLTSTLSFTWTATQINGTAH